VKGLSGALLEVRKVVAISVHGFEYLEDGVEGESGEIQQQEGPENVDLEHFEVAAEDCQSEGHGGPGPDALLAKRTC